MTTVVITRACIGTFSIRTTSTARPRRGRNSQGLKGKGSPYLIAGRRVPELIPVLDSQPAGDVNHKPGCHYFPPGLQLPSQPLRGLLPISLLGEQRHDGRVQFA